MRKWVATAALAAFAAVVACQAIIGFEDGLPREPDAGVIDAPVDTGFDAGTTFHDLSDPARWANFDLSAVRPGTTGYAGGAFDGRHVYFAPIGGGNSGLVTRFDTQAAFADPASWSIIDLTTLAFFGAGYMGAVAAKDRVYFVPYYRDRGGGADGGSPIFNATVSAYDPSRSFLGAGGWSFFDLRSLPGAPAGYIGGTFDGRHLYLAPFYNGGGFDGVVVRYDTQASFDAGTSWTSFDVSTVAPGARGFQGAVFDGRHAYFVPNTLEAGVSNGTAARFDTQGTFIGSPSWSTFDITTLNVNARGFMGGAFDGRYVYYVPSINDIRFAIVVRFDTQAKAFADPQAWSLFTLSSVALDAKGYQGAAFDGRFVYFVPNGGGTSGLVVRYDTTAPFAEATSWTSYDVGKPDGGPKGFRGAVFDGQYVYFVPMYGNVVARFHAKSPASMPPGQSGSFL